MSQNNSVKKGEFLSLLIGELGTSLLGNMLEDKWVIQAGKRATTTSREKRTSTAGEDF